MKTDYKYIKFVQREINDNKIWLCIPRKGGEAIGSVTLYPQWELYCFFPEVDTVWSAGCLADVQHFILQLEE